MLLAVTTAAGARCGGSTAVETVVGPDQVRCQTTLGGPSTPVPPDGGTVNVNVTAARDCTWTASSDATWMQLNATSGQGDATVAVTVARNDAASARSGGVAVNNQRVTISQQARPCTYQLRATQQSFGATGGRANISVETLAGCSWTATTAASWLRLVIASGSGSGTAEFEVAPNDGAARDGSISIDNQSVTIHQDSGTQPDQTCSVTANPTSINAVAAGGTHPVAITTSQPCDWTASSSAPAWLTVAPASGRGSSGVTVTVTRNTGAMRAGTVTIGNQSVAVSQAAAPACTATIEPGSANFAAAGGDGSVRVNTQEGCEWSVSGGASWVRVTTDRGTGTTDARYTVLANTATTTRSATLTIAGRSHTITQDAAAAACTYQLDPASRTFTASGGTGNVTVTTQGNCQWNVSAAPEWVTVQGGSGAGQGQFSYTVLANAGAARTATLMVNGQPHAITQDAAAPTCSYTLQPTSQNFPAAGGSNSFTVTTQAGCSWTAQAASGQTWVSVTSTSASSVSFSVAANTATSTRSTTITVNGTGGSATFTVTQDAAAAPTCSYSVQPSSQNFPAAGGSNSFTVTTQAGCTWTAQAASGQTWVSVTSTTATSVSYSVAANTATSTRSTTITVNGTGGSATFTVTQDAAAAPTCSYSVQPTSQNFPAAGGSNSFTVTTQAGCSWTAQAASGQTWASVTSTTASSVSFSVAANTATSTRSTTITVNGTGGSATFSVTQDAAPAPTCSYSVQPSSQNFPAAGGSNSFTVTTQAGCTWTAQAASGQTWASVTATTASSVSYSVAANTATSTRSTTITVNGTGGSATFSVTQDAAPAMQVCSFSISPGNADFGPLGGQGTIQVTTGATCSWTASEGVDWIALGSTGATGPGRVSYTVTPYGGDDRREATITVAGQSHRVRQDGEDDDLLVSWTLPIAYIT